MAPRAKNGAFFSSSHRALTRRHPAVLIERDPRADLLGRATDRDVDGGFRPRENLARLKPKGRTVRPPVGLGAFGIETERAREPKRARQMEALRDDHDLRRAE